MPSLQSAHEYCWCIAFCLGLSSGQALSGQDIKIDVANLPSRSLPEATPPRPIPRWLQTNLRIGHLPPGLGRMPEAYVKAGYNVVILNALRKWDIVGPSSGLYKPEEVKQWWKQTPDCTVGTIWHRTPGNGKESLVS